MQASNRTLTIRIGLLCLLAFISLGVHAIQPKTFPEQDTKSTRFADPYAFKDWMPDSTYNSILEHVRYYLAANNVSGRLLELTTAPHYNDDGSLSFDFHTDQSSTIYAALVQSNDYGGGLISTEVSVNDESVKYGPSDSLYQASFDGFENLTDSGLPGIQVYEIQKELVRYAGEQSFTLNTSSVSQKVVNSNTVTYGSVRIGSHTYQFAVTSLGITGIHIILTDNNGTQVFDSGSVTLSE